MSESPFTPFYYLIFILISLAFAYLEVAWLCRSFQLLWTVVIPAAIVNFLLLLVGYYVLTTYFALFFFPLPVVPALFIIIKFVTYTIIRKKTGVEFHGSWVVIPLMILGGSIIVSFILSLAENINPTYQNFYNAIQKGSGKKLEFMLWISVKDAKMMDNLLIEAISDNNVDAMIRLCRHGGRIATSEPYNYGSLETSWEYFRWQLDHVSSPDSIPYLYIAVSHYSADQLDYAIKKGFEVKKHSLLMGEILRNHNIRDTMVHITDTQQDLVRKLTVLFQHGATTNDIDEYGIKPISALFGSRWRTKIQVLKILIHHGANPNEATPQAININDTYYMPAGFTPLMSAALLDDEACVNLLLANGADKFQKNSEGKIAADYAQHTSVGARILGQLKDTKPL